MAKKIFISFDYTNDHYYKDLLRAWNANRDFDFSFNDCTPSEIQSDDVSRVKAMLTTKIIDADVVLVIVGAECNKRHPDWYKIGYLNWQVFEIEKAKMYNKPIVAVKLNMYNQAPDCLIGIGASWAMSFTYDAIKRALDNA